MKIEELPGWPPRNFQCTDDHTLPFDSDQRGLVLTAVDYVPAGSTGSRQGDIVLTLVDNKRAEKCTTRWKVQDSDLARRVQEALGTCMGLTLVEAGLRVIG